MTLKEELVDCLRLYATSLNCLANTPDRVKETVQFFESHENLQEIVFNEAPLTEEFGRRISQA